MVSLQGEKLEKSELIKSQINETKAQIFSQIKVENIQENTHKFKDKKVENSINYTVRNLELLDILVKCLRNKLRCSPQLKLYIYERKTCVFAQIKVVNMHKSTRKHLQMF